MTLLQLGSAARNATRAPGTSPPSGSLADADGNRHVDLVGSSGGVLVVGEAMPRYPVDRSHRR